MSIRSKIQEFMTSHKERGLLHSRVQHFQHVAIEAGRKLAAVQHLADILTNNTSSQTSTYVGNGYQSYTEQITELDKKYRGVADWGNQMVSNIIDIRSAFTIGQGIRPRLKKGKEGATRELEFIKTLMEQNSLDADAAQDWCTEAELEGKFLCRLFPNRINKSIDLRFIPWITQKYKIITSEGDYMNYIRAEYHLNGTGELQRVGPDLFVYKKFGGRKHLVNEASPKVGKLLTAIENLDKAMWDWRKINHLFAAPTPYFEALDADAAKAMQEALDKMNWKIGKALVGTAKHSMVQANGSGIADVIEREVMNCAKIVSAGVSIPVHFLGFPDLMSNRSTSTDLFELIQAGTNRERQIWIGFYEELFQKAIKMYNAEFQGGLDPEAVEVEIPFVTAAKMKEIVEIWLPLFTSNAIDLETLLSKIPDVDAEQVQKNLEEREQAQLERIKAEADIQDPHAQLVEDEA